MQTAGEHRPHTTNLRALELRATVRLAVPIVLVQVGFMAMGVVDTLMVGHRGAAVLAAVALGNLYFVNASMLGMGALMALDPVVAQSLGARELEGVSRAIQRALLLALGFSLFTALVMVPALPVLRAFHQPPDVAVDAARYVVISIVGVLPFFAFVVLRQTLQAMHRVAPVVWTMIAANLTNAGLNWVFVYGHLGSPAFGAAGSAIATAVSRWLMVILLLAGAWPALRPHLLPVRHDVWRPLALRRMLALGLPIGVQMTLETAAFGAIGLLMGVLGTTDIAAHQIAITLASFTFMVPVGVGSAAAVRVGHAIGARDARRARAAMRAAYICGVGFMCVTAVIFLGVPSLLARAFTGDTQVIALAALLIPVAGVFQVFDGAQAVGAGVLRGAGDTTAPLLVMLAAYWLVGVPVSAYLGFRTSMGPVGLWWGFVVSLATVAVFLFLRVRVVFGRELRRVHIEQHDR
ncbi:MAG TPA: MATE family efflux transporter [Gemmatimonadaceae bacterium]